jgi:hypothetical protein
MGAIAPRTADQTQPLRSPRLLFGLCLCHKELGADGGRFVLRLCAEFLKRHAGTQQEPERGAEEDTSAGRLTGQLRLCRS